MTIRRPMLTTSRAWVLALLASGPLAITGTAAEPGAEAGELRAGAARLELTPALDALPSPYKTVLDRIFVRALVLEDGTERAAIVSVDTVNMGEPFWAAVSERVEREAGIPVRNLVLAATHSHSAPRMTGVPSVPPDQRGAAYNARGQDVIVEALKHAVARLQPARMGSGSGQAYVNVNRNVFLREAKGWFMYQAYMGLRSEEPSDKTVAVIRFEAVSGAPIALLINYAVHGVVNGGGTGTEVSGDLPGATARFVESRYAGQAVALWTTGAAGNQDPIYKAWIDRRDGPTPEERQANHALLDTLARMLGEEVVLVANSISRTSPQVAIASAQKVVTCPGQKVTPVNHPFRCAYPGWPVDTSALPPCADYRVESADDVRIRVGVLMIGRVALATVSGEPLTLIGQRLKRESPLRNTVLISLANGASGYLPDDATYGRFTYESTNSRVAKGCAEDAVVGSLLEMMGQP